MPKYRYSEASKLIRLRNRQRGMIRFVKIHQYHDEIQTNDKVYSLLDHPLFDELPGRLMNMSENELEELSKLIKCPLCELKEISSLEKKLGLETIEKITTSA